MRIICKWLITLPFILISIVFITAQETCDPIVQQAIDTASTNCEGLRRNQACYGNVTIDAEAVAGADDFQFSSAGDIVAVTDIASMRLSSQNSDEWGISLLRLQAYLSGDSVPEDVQLVLFGDVTIANDFDSTVSFELIADANANVRQEPNGSASITGGLRIGQTVIARGQIVNDVGEEWIRIDYPDDPNNTHWVISWALRGDNLSNLPLIPQDTTTFNTFEAFYMTSSEPDTCGDDLESGLLIQTPQGAGRFTMQVNELQIEIGSTVFIETTPSDVMHVYVIEGDIAVDGADATVFATTGTRISIPVDSNGVVSGQPILEAYDESDLGILPLGLLDEPVIVPTPLTEAEIEQYAQQFEIEGTWASSFDPSGMQICADNSGGAGTYETDYIFAQNPNTGALMVVAPLEVPLVQIGPRTYEFYFLARQSIEYFRIEFVSDNLIVGENTLTDNIICTLNWTFTLTR